MSSTCVEEKIITNSYIDERMKQVNEIRKAHSQKLFGYAHASIKEIRDEAVKSRLEAIYNA